MAVDKLVDSTQLDTDLTSVANAIRAKSGGSSQLAFPAGFVSEIGNIPTGGGGGAFQVLETITVPANTRAVNIDFTDYLSYDVFFVVEDVTLTASDWLYYVKNGSSPSGGKYGFSAVNHEGVCFIQFSKMTSKNNAASFVTSVSGSNESLLFAAETVSNLYIYTYASTKYIAAGSKFYIIGGNYADL